MFRKSLITGVALLAMLIVGFVFLLKGCLAKYDERFMRAPALVFEKDGKTVVFTVVEFQKTTSYSRSGGFVRKSVNTSFYVQLNDGATGAMLDNKKVKSQRSIKNFPVEVLGAAGTNAWIFMGEPMAFDAFSLEKTADISILEQKNPTLSGKFPADRQYYQYNKEDHNIYFTAIDGSKWQLNRANLVATRADFRKGQNLTDMKITNIENELKKIQVQSDSLYQQKNYRAAKDYQEKKIDYATYQRITSSFYREREILDDLRDSLQQLKSKLEDSKRSSDDRERAIENLERMNQGFSQIKAYQDTLNGEWYGFYSPEEMDKLWERVSDNSVNDETARRSLWVSRYEYKRNDAVIDKQNAAQPGSVDMLDGGFLLDKKTARAFHTTDGAFLVVHREQLGREGKLQVSCMDKTGKLRWTVNTGLTEWADWIFQSGRLFIFGTDNKELSSSETNVLLTIRLDNGQHAAFDFFNNKLRK